ncbi:tRNA modification GTPase TrmE [Sulfuricella denitrificans skB26]|uniref:tRNA modification GTPase MnmE n=1 Tax=Sulfuricella denitrificans (strain DSM 22764 / NBRC 105220 / skB26) TaxID=1163617 RepID=S6AKB5_SULDS|nr:tRNA uridine-5-carboxymethylaminomethyl(34) synthesis GTPase MnmE [Sulfuricella denitrificans]BAN36831.1 tRNA modification GTPase TrmE [Sulfuricella denitrificans skB26]
MVNTDTIAAIATAHGRGGIGVVRVSGEDLRVFAKKILGKNSLPRVATLSDFLGADGEVIDQGIALSFPAPHSYTGQDVLELQGHGGDAVLRRVLSRCLELGARPAEPGEFTQRAFLNDKMDLAQAESVADLIDAATVEAAKTAMRSLRGEFSHAIHQLVDALTSLRMLVEATLDFPEEEIDFLEESNALNQLVAISAQLDKVFHQAKQGSLLREGLHIVLIGQPNVGKSSLLNQLAGEEVSIVTPVAGTTRDAIRQHIEIEGVALHFIDTAGLRETDEEVEKIGIARTWSAIQQANAALLLIDAAKGIAPVDLDIITKLPSGLPLLRVFNKVDLLGQEPRVDVVGGTVDIYLSAKTGAGVDLLHEHLLRVVGWQTGGEGVFIARERHLSALRVAKERLTLAATCEGRVEFFAEELRLAQNALSSITGEFTSDDLLGEIFSRFCIGK